MILTWLLPERGSGPPWKDGAAEGSGVPFSHWPVGKEEGKMGEISPLAPTQCAHHPKEKKKKKRKEIEIHSAAWSGLLWGIFQEEKHQTLLFIFCFFLHDCEKNSGETCGAALI